MVAPRSMSMHHRDQSMDSKPNRNIQRLTLHVAVGTLAAALSSIFSAVFLIRVGLAPVQIFLAFAAILALRFIIRPVVLIATPAMGLRRALVFGSVLCSLSCPVLALVDGVGLARLVYCRLGARSGVLLHLLLRLLLGARRCRPQGQPDRD
jgi:polyferredoxin